MRMLKTWDTVEHLVMAVGPSGWTMSSAMGLRTVLMSAVSLVGALVTATTTTMPQLSVPVSEVTQILHKLGT